MLGNLLRLAGGLERDRFRRRGVHPPVGCATRAGGAHTRALRRAGSSRGAATPGLLLDNVSRRRAERGHGPVRRGQAVRGPAAARGLDQPRGMGPRGVLRHPRRRIRSCWSTPVVPATTGGWRSCPSSATSVHNRSWCPTGAPRRARPRRAVAAAGPGVPEELSPVTGSPAVGPHGLPPGRAGRQGSPTTSRAKPSGPSTTTPSTARRSGSRHERRQDAPSPRWCRKPGGSSTCGAAHQLTARAARRRRRRAARPPRGARDAPAHLRRHRHRRTRRSRPARPRLRWPPSATCRTSGSTRCTGRGGCCSTTPPTDVSWTSSSAPSHMCHELDLSASVWPSIRARSTPPTSC